jgi:hypothetical protein
METGKVDDWCTTFWAQSTVPPVFGLKVQYPITLWKVVVRMWGKWRIKKVSFLTRLPSSLVDSLVAHTFQAKVRPMQHRIFPTVCHTKQWINKNTAHILPTNWIPSAVNIVVFYMLQLALLAICRSVQLLVTATILKKCKVPSWWAHILFRITWWVFPLVHPSHTCTKTTMVESREWQC